MMTYLVFDIETNISWDKIHVVVTRNIDTGEVICHRSPESLAPLLAKNVHWIAHNGVGFDVWVLEKVWNLKIPLENLTDTLILSRLLNPELEGGHSLSSWGERMSFPKSEFNDFSQWSQELQDRCVIDCELTERVYKLLTSQLKAWQNHECVNVEHDVAKVISDQERHGWMFNLPGAFALRSKWEQRLMKIEEEMQKIFPPKMIMLKTKGKELLFNPGSRKQIAERLIEKGWKPKQKTEGGAFVVNEVTLAACPVPEAKMFLEYLLYQKRISQIAQWIEACKDDGRIHGKVNPNGAVTGRMTHFRPNMAQVPRVTTQMGPECRELFIAPNALVGIDASGIELRMLAHFMGDEAYVKVVSEGDVHTANQQAAGLATRDQAKTFIYAYLYGAGDAKIGTIVGKGSAAGAALREQFLKNTPALSKLRDRVERAAGRGYLIGIDGRHIHIRSAHAALNTLLQSAAAVVMKKAVVLFTQSMGDFKFQAQIVGNIHDEWQVECFEEDADAIGRLGVQAIVDAGIYFGLNCPLDGAYRVGKNWKETH